MNHGLLRRIDARRTMALFFGILAVGTLLLRCAWQSDDAYITYRTVDNFLHGYGLRWNVAERVQAYTHPTWMMVTAVVAAMTGEFYYSTLVASMLIACCAVGVVASFAATPALAVFACVALASSRALIDYGACGLENPLLFLLVACLVRVGLQREPSAPRTRWLGLLTALLALTRPDAIVLSLPLLVHAIGTSPSRRSALADALVGLSPLFLWEAFSLVYYGAFVPNTAYAKLNLHIPRGALLWKGVAYVRDSLRRDFTTLPLVMAGVVSGVWGSGSSKAAERMVALGVLAYVAAIVWVGGDFMSGRFWGAPLVGALALLLFRFRRSSPPSWIPLLVSAGLSFCALALPRSHWRSGLNYGVGVEQDAKIDAEGIADERGFYYPWTGLRRVFKHRHRLQQEGAPIPPYVSAIDGVRMGKEPAKVVIYREVGLFGFFVGPGVHVIDPYGLADPLLSRLPFQADDSFRPGHYFRPVPSGYRKELEGTGFIVDPKVRALYQRVALITRGPLFTVERWEAIVDNLLGTPP